MTYKEEWDKLSIEMKSWITRKATLRKFILDLERRLAPDLVGHFENRIYTNATQVKIGKLNKAKKELEELKRNRPEPIKPRRKIFSTDELLEKFDKLSSIKKVDILFTALNYMESNNSQDKNVVIMRAMNYTKTKEGWEKN